MPYAVLEDHFERYPEDFTSRVNIAHFGRVAVDWKTLCNDVAAQAQVCDADDEIKIIFFSRHGHAVHNDIPEPPLPHWSRLVGKRDSNALDPALTIIGEEQVSNLNLRLREAARSGLPLPTKVFTSIARRTCQTALTTWDALVPSESIQALHNLRDYLCGKQFSKLAPFADIQPLFPGIAFEAHPHVNDKLWNATGGTETQEAFTERVHAVFDDVWQKSQGHDVVAIVSHLDVFETLWPHLGLGATKFEKGEMRMLVVKRTKEG